MTSDSPPDRTSANLYALGGRVPAKRPGIRIEGDTGSLTDRHSEVFYAAIQTTRMPMILSDPRQPDNPIVFSNQAFLTMTGYEAAEIIGRNCRFLQGPDTDPATIADIRAALVKRQEFATEILNYRKDGYTFWNALFISPVFDSNGELIYFFASQLDVSRRRKAEEELRQSQKIEAIGRLTGGIAHDFNNLLQVMVGYLDLIGSGLRKPDIDRDKLIRNVGNARSAADRAASLTQQLLSFARKQRLEGRTLNLNDLVERMSRLADRTLGDDVTIESKVEPDLWNCRIDPTQIETAVLNILINARDAMAGTLHKRVVIETRNVSVEHEDMARFHNLGPGRYASIAVTDSGSGMPAQIVERVMDPFFTTKEEGKGTGLGLSMVYGFARQSGGAAHITSEVDKGTTIRIYFPAVDEPATKVERHGGSALDRPGHETILVVEDRTDVAEMARMILQDFGYTVLQASNGPDALAILAGDHPIDLLFSDLIMPGGIDGVTLARTAKSLRPQLKVLLTTGFAEASLERSEIGGPEFDVLNKPYGRSELARKVRIILDGPTGVS